MSLVRDHSIKENLAEVGISVQSYNGDLLYEPWEIYDEKGHAFSIFDAYWDKCLHMPVEPVALPPPWRLVLAAGKILISLYDILILLYEECLCLNPCMIMSLKYISSFSYKFLV